MKARGVSEIDKVIEQQFVREMAPGHPLILSTTQALPHDSGLIESLEKQYGEMTANRTVNSCHFLIQCVVGWVRKYLNEIRVNRR